MVHPELFYCAVSAIQRPLSLHQCLLVPFRAGVGAGLPEHQGQGQRGGKHPQAALCDPLQSPEHLGDVLPLGVFFAVEPGTQT
ncbi:hypothetical protein D3C77_719050 [compost metagenome]